MFATYFGNPSWSTKKSTAIAPSRPTRSTRSSASGSARTIARACSTCRAKKRRTKRATARRAGGCTYDSARDERQPRPIPGPPREYHFPRFERRTLANGIELVVAPVKKLPLVTVVVLVDAGAVCDPEGREGAAQLVAKLLLEGTDGVRRRRAHRAVRAARRVDRRVGRLGRRRRSSMTSLSRASAGGVRAARRSHPHARVSRARGRSDSRTSGSPSCCSCAPSRAGWPTSCSRASSIRAGVALRASRRRRREDRRRHRARPRSSRSTRRAIAPSATTLIVAGDVTRRCRRGDGARSVRRLEGRRPAERVIANDSPARLERAVHLVAKTDAPQSELRIGHVGIPRNHPDFFPVNVMNAVLGGLFNSRINLNLREVHGYTYGAFSAFDWRRQAGSVRRAHRGEDRRHRRGGARDSASRSIAFAPSRSRRTSCRSRRAISTASFRFASRRRRRSPRRSRPS